MDIYRLNLSWTELESLKAAVGRAVDELEKCHESLNAELDSPISSEHYAKGLKYLENVTKSKKNMLSILSKAELSHE